MQGKEREMSSCDIVIMEENPDFDWNSVDLSKSKFEEKTCTHSDGGKTVEYFRNGEVCGVSFYPPKDQSKKLFPLEEIHAPCLYRRRRFRCFLVPQD